LHISDPGFFPKMAHLISLYNNPPKNLYCFDECPGIQILQRLVPDLQTEQMKLRIEEFEYIRHGTTDVFALFDVNTGKIMAECRKDHTKETLIKVFENYLECAPKDQQLDYIMDNLNSHCCYELCQLVAKYCNIKCPSEKELNTMSERRKWLSQENKRIIFHYTPYHGSWLNQVEYWFGMLNAKCLHETYHSPQAMHQAIKSFVILWNEILAEPFKWNYSGEGLHEKVVKRFIAMLNNTIKIDNRMIVKQLKLHVNIVKDYWELVDINLWHHLFEKFIEQKYLIEYVITTAIKKDIEEDLEYIGILKNIMEQKLSISLAQAK
jgi:putative transposase